jgi:hypothetical protein
LCTCAACQATGIWGSPTVVAEHVGGSKGFESTVPEANQCESFESFESTVPEANQCESFESFESTVPPRISAKKAPFPHESVQRRRKDLSWSQLFHPLHTSNPWELC